MKWQMESLAERHARLFEWHRRLALRPHACENRQCRNVRWLEFMLSKIVISSVIGDGFRKWACSEECAIKADKEMP